MATQYRVVWQDAKKHNKIRKGDWVGKTMIKNWERDSAPKLPPTITFEIQQRGK